MPHVPEWSILRDVGLAMYGGLMCWLAALAVLLRRSEAGEPGTSAPEENLDAVRHLGFPPGAYAPGSPAA